MILTADHEAGLETEIVSEGRPQAVRTAHRIARANRRSNMSNIDAALGTVEKRGSGERSDNSQSARPTPTAKRGKRMDRQCVGCLKPLVTCQPSVARIGFLI